VTDTDHVVIFFGDFREEKGVLQLIAAAIEAQETIPDLKVVLVGGLNMKARVKRYAQRLNEALAVALSKRFLIMVTNPDPLRVAGLLRAADLAVFPFLDGACENRGSILAAIANETATLTTLGKSTAPGFSQDYGVEVVPAADVHALTARMTDLLLDPQRLATLRQRASAAALTCSWEAIAHKHLEIYTSLARQQLGDKRGSFANSPVMQAKGQ
jgi:glycosyltransferase involved in cell wall biosynthesis